MQSAFSFSKRFMLDKIAVDPESIPGTLSASQEYTRNGTPVNPRTPWTHDLTLIHRQGATAEVIHLLACF